MGIDVRFVLPALDPRIALAPPDATNVARIPRMTMAVATRMPTRCVERIVCRRGGLGLRMGSDDDGTIKSIGQ